MTEQVEVSQETKEVETVDYKSMFEESKALNEELQGKLAAVVNKKEELLAETKKAKEERRKQEQLVEQTKIEQAQKNGEFEKLWKQAENEKQKLQEEINTERQNRRSEKISLSAMKVAVELAKGDANKAELLSTFIAESISKVADDLGTADEALLSSVKQQFETDAKFSPLLGGNQSVGGSAPGNNRSASSQQKMTRDEFNGLSLDKQSAFALKVREGQAQLIDN